MTCIFYKATWYAKIHLILCLKASVQVEMNLQKFIIFSLTSGVLYTDIDAEIMAQNAIFEPGTVIYSFWSSAGCSALDKTITERSAELHWTCEL